MKAAICPLCGGRESKKCFSERKYDLLNCNTCELFFINPYDPYETDIHKRVVNYEYEDFKSLDPIRFHISSKISYKKIYLSFIEKECVGANSLLDVGCGTGALLELLLERNPRIRGMGIELNKARANYAKKTTQCEIFQVPVEDFSCEGKFDVITMINVLSHIPSFDKLFTSLRNLIADKGKLILKVGEVAAEVRKDALFDWGIPDHLHFLGMRTIQFICNKYGFREVQHEKHPLSADFFSRSRWFSPGRSSVRNVVKRTIAMTPFALPTLRKIYDKKHENSIYSSFIVLSPS
jgi:SAM-dependent methyltransferase